jgi:hypothetical protein
MFVAAALLVLPLVLGVANAGGRTLAVSEVTVQVIGQGTVTSDPAGMNCGNGSTTCHIAFSGGTGDTVELTATPATDWTFESWSGCTPTGANTCEVALADSDHEVTANFTGPPTTTSTLSVTRSGNGDVTGGGIECGSSGGTDCTRTVLTGSTLTVRETPASDHVFTGWGGACSGTGVTCTVHLAGDRSVSASWVSSAAVLLTVSVSGNGSVTGGGINCPPTCAASQAVNSTVVLTATPADGYVFDEWGGACSGEAPTCSVLMNEAKSVTATFAPVVTLSVNVTGQGNGTVTGAGGRINCGNNGSLCSANLPRDESVTLTAAPAAGSTFTGWGGACAGTATTCTVLMSESRGVSATFTPEAQLTVNVVGNGNVSGESGAINCGNGANICSASFPPNRSVTLNATPAPGATFTGWTGPCGGSASTCTIRMNQAKCVTATFSGGAGGTGATVTLAVSVNGPGTVGGPGIACGNGATACSANVAVNSNVTLFASPASGATFAGWGGACSGSSSTCTLTMTAARGVTASFSGGSVSTASLSVSVIGRGRVTGGGINCGNGATTCALDLPLSSVVTLAAAPASGARFTGWGGMCSGRATTCTLTMSAARSVTATFAGAAAARRTLTIRVVGRGTVRTTAGRCTGRGARKTCVQRFASGTAVVLWATAARGARFNGWRGACRGKARTCRVTLSTAKTVTATFVRRRRR